MLTTLLFLTITHFLPGLPSATPPPANTIAPQEMRVTYRWKNPDKPEEGFLITTVERGTPQQLRRLPLPKSDNARHRVLDSLLSWHPITKDALVFAVPNLPEELLKKRPFSAPKRLNRYDLIIELQGKEGAISKPISFGTSATSGVLGGIISGNPILMRIEPVQLDYYKNIKYVKYTTAALSGMKLWAAYTSRKIKGVTIKAKSTLPQMASEQPKPIVIIKDSIIISIIRPGQLIGNKFLNQDTILPPIPTSPPPVIPEVPKKPTSVSAHTSNHGASPEAVIKTLDDKYKVTNSAGVRRRGDTLFVYLDTNLHPVAGAVVPTCNKKGTYYRFFIIGPTPPDGTTYELQVSAASTRDEDLAVLDGNNVGNAAKSKTDTVTYTILRQQLVGPFDGSVQFDIRLFKTEKNGARTEVSKKSIEVPSCDRDKYDVSIALGFYRSELDDPDKIRIATNSSGVRTLEADHPNNQRVLTVMAVFHPTKRQIGYRYRDLKYWQKWSVNFGTKISQNIFDDLFLGLSYEFAKGGSFASGAHYGQHTTIVGYNRFRFGETQYDRPDFTPEVDTRQRWDLSWYIGVNIDSRIISHLRNNNSNNEDLRR